MILRGTKRSTGRSTGRQDVMIWSFSNQQSTYRYEQRATYANIQFQTASDLEVTGVAILVRYAMYLRSAHDRQYRRQKTQGKDDGQAKLHCPLQMQSLYQRYRQKEYRNIAYDDHDGY